MNKKLLLKYLKGTTSPEQSRSVEDWIMSDESHLRYFTQLKDISVLSGFSNLEATDDQMKIAESIMNGGAGIRHGYGSAGRARLYRISYYAVAAVVLAALITNIFISTVNRDQSEGVIPDNRLLLSEVPESFMHTIYTNKGVKGEVTLPDGSHVKLNSDTKIIFPDKFVGSSREVYISGEAFFSVVPDKDKPMIVTTENNILVKVLGTKFNVRSYDNEETVKTTLYSGRIDILKKENNGDVVFLTEVEPEETFQLDMEYNIQKTYSSDTLKVNAWTRGNLIFEATPMRDVLKELERWYGMDFIVNDETIYGKSLSADFKQESIGQIMEIIKFCTRIDYHIDDNNIVTLF